jgi:hypothetical protein
MKLKHPICVLWLGILPLIAASCDYDHGIDPISTKITGEVTFSGQAPWYVTEVRVAVAKRFPPVDLTEDLLYSERLPKDQASVQYEILATPGDYAATGVLWRRSGEAWTLSNILGLYTTPGSFTPAPVTISPQQPRAENVNMAANWELALRDSYIEGDITFAGVQPADTDIMALAMFPIVPQSQFDYLSVKALDLNVQKNVRSFHYRTPVTSGEYKFISIFWKGKTGTIFDVRAIGFYRSPADTTKPGSVTVASGATATGIDFTAYFNSLPGGVDFKISDAPPVFPKKIFSPTQLQKKD